MHQGLIDAILGVTVFTRFAVALGISLKAKNKKNKEVADAAINTAFLGVTELAIYGCSLRDKKHNIYLFDPMTLKNDFFRKTNDSFSINLKIKSYLFYLIWFKNPIKNIGTFEKAYGKRNRSMGTRNRK